MFKEKNKGHVSVVDSTIDLESTNQSFQLLRLEIERIDILIQRLVDVSRQDEDAADTYKGLFISGKEVDALQSRPLGAKGRNYDWLDEHSLHHEQCLEDIKNKLDKAVKENKNSGSPYPLYHLISTFGLSEFDKDILLICLASELDLRYEKLYAYLQDDVTKKYPTVELVLNLLSDSLDKKLELREYLINKSPLLRHKFIELFEEPSQQNPSFLAKYLKLDPYIADFLLKPDASINGGGGLGFFRWSSLLIPDEIKERIKPYSRLDKEAFDRHILYFYGPQGAGKSSCVTAICSERKKSVIWLDLSLYTNEADEVIFARFETIVRNAQIENAVVCLKNFDLLLEEGKTMLLSRVIKIVESADTCVFITSDRPWVPGTLLQKTLVSVSIPPPTFSLRKALWEQQLKHLVLQEPIDANEIASLYRLNVGQIHRAITSARNKAQWRNIENPEITRDDILTSCREQCHHKLGELAKKITPRYRWGDIVLPPKKEKQLKEVFYAAKNRNKIFESWGFDQKVSIGKGLNVLFSGPSGTGKTMSAEILAYELGLDLYKIDLSRMVSKYIGETEKNLSKIFDEAESTNAILFFDEADALFGKRSEVSSAHDRYANIETGYLLQKMEEYSGITILATNLDKNIDNAFSRRISFMIDFPMPNKNNRLRIWQNIWPKSMPMFSDVDLEYVANNFDLAGGNIKNIALNTAFFAAEDGERVEMKHLIRGIHREYQKIGKVSTGKEFGEYQHYVEDL